MVVPRETKVALLAGGTSGEREISLASGKGATEALLEAGFVVETLDPANRQDLVRLIEEPFDVAFLCLHGKGGEDGTVQGMLDVLGIPYTGPGVWSSATAINKTISKIFYERHGVPTPASCSVTTKEPLQALRAFTQEYGWPVVVKPATEGSALGVFIVNTEEEAKQALEQALSMDSEVLVERYVAGTEITVAVLGNNEPVALPVIEIVPCNSFYDFEAKYAPGGSKHICPATISNALTETAKDYALRAHKALGCKGMSRTDMIVDENNSIWVLETNTIPGMTQTSLLPDAAKAAGLSFPELCTQLIEFALES